MNLGNKMAESFRSNGRPRSNANNIYTTRRKQMLSQIKEQTGGDPDSALDYSLQLIHRGTPQIQQYILSHGEIPAKGVKGLAIQAFQLRRNQIKNIAGIMGLNPDDAQIFIEDDEAENDEQNSGDSDSYLGEYSAPVFVAGEALTAKGAKGSDNFVDPSLVTGIINTVGTKVNSGDLMRAAQNKNAGILGFLGTGGTAGYNALKKYLQDPKNADEKAAVIAGRITSESQLRGYGGGANLGTGGGISANDVINNVVAAKKAQLINQYLPIAIVAILVIVLVTVLISRRAKS